MPYTSHIALCIIISPQAYHPHPCANVAAYLSVCFRFDPLKRSPLHFLHANVLRTRPAFRIWNSHEVGEEFASDSSILLGRFKGFFWAFLGVFRLPWAPSSFENRRRSKTRRFISLDSISFYLVTFCMHDCTIVRMYVCTYAYIHELHVFA